jgi:hypothetical protein
VWFSASIFILGKWPGSTRSVGKHLSNRIGGGMVPEHYNLDKETRSGRWHSLFQRHLHVRVITEWNFKRWYAPVEQEGTLSYNLCQVLWPGKLPTPAPNTRHCRRENTSSERLDVPRNSINTQITYLRKRRDTNYCSPWFYWFWFGSFTELCLNSVSYTGTVLFAVYF